MMQNQKALSVEEACEFLKLSRSYVYKLIHLRKIPCYKPLNGRIYFRVEELEAFVFGNKREAVCEGVNHEN